MGEHTEDMAKTWNIGRHDQDELALQAHQRAVAAQDRDFFADLIVPVEGITKDHFPRRDTSIEKLAKLKPAFDRSSGRGTLTAGNSSPLTDGAPQSGWPPRKAWIDCPAGYHARASWI